MNVQVKQQGQGQFDSTAGYEAGVHTRNVENTEQVKAGTCIAKTFEAGKTSLIAQDYNKAIIVSARLVGTTIEELQSSNRADSIALGRMLVAWYMCEQLEYSRPDIAKVFCRDRSTVYYCCRKFKELLSVKDRKAVRLYTAFMNEINK